MQIYRHITFVVAFLAWCIGVQAMESKQNIASELDSVFLNVQKYYSSGPKGLYYIDRLHELALMHGEKEFEWTAIEYKAGTYVNLFRYKDLDILVDSIETQTNIAKESMECYFYVLYTQVMANVNRSKFKLAIKQAEKLYEASRDYQNYKIENTQVVINGKETNQLVVPTQISCRLSALRCMATAYNGVKHYERAIEYIKEGLAITNEAPEVFSSERVDFKTDLIVATYGLEKERMKSLPEGERFSQAEIDRFETLRLLKQYTSDIDIHRENSDDGSVSCIFYEAFQRCRYIDVYCDIHEYNKATRQYIQLMTLLDEQDDQSSVLGASGYLTLVKYFRCLGDYAKADQCIDSMAVLSEYNNSHLLELLKLKFSAYQNTPFDEGAFSLASRIIELSDSLNEDRIDSSIDEVGAMMGIDRYERQALELSNKQQRTIYIFIIFVLLAIVVFVFIEIRRSNERREMLANQKRILEQEIVRQTSELREKNRDITASINYAQKIQEAILPDIEKYVGHGISGAFSICRPCEIVSGDFYWAMTHGDELLVACADCTGHGVPGALMSMIGSTILNELCSHDHLPAPDEILEELDRQILDVLTRKSDNEVKDGMEIVLMAYNTETHTLRISAARGTAFLFLSDEMVEIQRVRRSIGDREAKTRQRNFVTQTYNVKEGDTIYLSTDGIIDQFGGQATYGADGTRFTLQRYTDLLKSVHNADSTTQRDMIIRHLDDWRGTLPQIDDVTILGIRF